MRFDREQLRYIKCDTANNIIVGNPGSGKTTALVERIQFLTTEREYPPRSQLVMTFFKPTQQNLLHKLGSVFGNDLARQQVRTVHSICYALTAGNGCRDVSTLLVRALGTDENVYRDYFSTVTHVYIDEAQILDDLMVDFIERLRSVCCWLSIDVLGDPAQNCWRRVACERDEFMVGYRGHRYELVKNYRSARKIVEFCNLTHPFQGLEPMQAVQETDGTVDLCVGNRCQQFDHFHKVLCNLDVSDTIAIICACRHATPGMTTHLCCQDIANFLWKVGTHDFELWYDETKSKNESSSTGKRCDGHIVITTIHGSLGREFDHVMVFAYHHATNKRKPTREDHYHHSKMFHIARSRARKSLTLFAGDDRELFVTPPAAFSMMRHFGCSPKLVNTTKDCFAKIRNDEEDITHVAMGRLNEMDPARLAKIQDLFQISYDRHSIWPSPELELPDYEQLCTLYGRFAEAMVNLGSGQSPEHHSLVQFTAAGTLVISNGHRPEARYIVQQLDLVNSYMTVTTSRLRQLAQHVEKRLLDAKRGRFFQAVLTLVSDEILQHCDHGQTTVTLHFEHPNIWCELDELRRHVQQELTPATVFRTCLFWWQYENQSAWRMDKDYSEHLNALSPFFRLWMDLGKRYRTAALQVPCLLVHEKFPSHRIIGAADAVIDQHVVEWKFARAGLTETNRLQLALYAFTLSLSGQPVTASLGNLFTGEIQTIRYKQVDLEALFECCFL